MHDNDGVGTAGGKRRGLADDGGDAHRHALRVVVGVGAGGGVDDFLGEGGAGAWELSLDELDDGDGGTEALRGEGLAGAEDLDGGAGCGGLAGELEGGGVDDGREGEEGTEWCHFCWGGRAF